MHSDVADAHSSGGLPWFAGCPCVGGAVWLFVGTLENSEGVIVKREMVCK